MLLVATAAASAATGFGPGLWDGFRGTLRSWEALGFDRQFGFNVGDAKGTRFTFESEGFSMKESRLLGASLSKWPSAVMISGVVADGYLSYDDKASKYLKYWSTNERDPRSKVTLRTLLSFTSGILEDPSNLCIFGDFEKCAENLYNALEGRRSWTTPNSTFQYLSSHLQFAGAMASAASGIPIQDLFEKYLYKRYNMTSTTYAPLRDPSMAAGITTTGADFEGMLSGLLTYRGLPKAIQDQMERDYTKAPVDPSGDGWFGHYAMGHWWECLGYGTPSERRDLPSICTEAHIQAGPGEFGYYPLIDRSGGGDRAGPTRPEYYMQIPLQEPDPLSGIPEYLRIAAKPIVDTIMAGHRPESIPRKTLLEYGGGLIARDITFIEGELGKCTCSGVPDRKGEPYRTLSKSLPADDQKKNRERILADGEGITLFDIAEMQQELGVCTCEGRK